MAYDEGLAERIRDFIRHRPNLAERKMFGGLAFMLNGHMFVGILGDTLMARIGPAQYPDALRQAHTREMDFTGKPMKGFVFVAPEGFEADSDLERWIDLCVKFVEILPPK